MTTHVFREKRLGFNAIELVVVVFVVFILIGVALVVLKMQRRNERPRAQTSNNLKQLSLACHSYHDVYKKLPPAFDNAGLMNFPASMHVHLLPFIEQEDSYKKYLAQKGVGDWDQFVIPPFIAPMGDFTQTNAGAGIQNFAANLRVFSDKGLATNFDANMPALAGIETGTANYHSISDGSSNTISFATKYANCKNGGSRFVAAPDSTFAAFFGQNAATITARPSDPRATFQAQPTAGQCLTTPLMAQSLSERGLFVGMADGSFRIISTSMSPRTWNLVVQPNDGMQPGHDRNDWID